MKKPYDVTMEEQETTIRIGRIDDLAYIDTTDSTMITKLRNLLKADDTEWVLVDDDGVGLRVTCPKNLITLRTKKAVRKAMTEEQKQAFADRMEAYRETI